MDAAEKRNKLISLAKGVISNPANENEIKYLLHRFALTEEDLIQAYLDWDLSPDSYGNEIYDFVPIRFAMYLHYLLPGSWHEARQDIITNILDDYPKIFFWKKCISTRSVQYRKYFPLKSILAKLQALTMPNYAKFLK